jgi:Tol biopolymer transport system component
LPELQPLTPPALDRMVNACLAKDPGERWQAAHDLELELRWIAAGQFGDRAVSAAPNKRERALWAAIALLISLLAAGTWIWTRRSAKEESLRLTVLPPPGESLVFSTNQGGLAISPDGKTLAFVATNQGTPMIWLRPLNSPIARPLTGTEGGYYPFWSPESRSLGFFAAGKLKTIDTRGGLPQNLADAPEGRGGSWNRDGVIVYGPGFGAIYRVSAAGGTPAKVTKIDPAHPEEYLCWPSFLPDGRHFLYLAADAHRENDAIFVGSVDAGPETQKPLRVTAANSNAFYAPGHDGRHGYVLYMLDRTLTARQFDAGSLKAEGDSIAIADQAGYLTNLALGNFSLSQTGLLVYGPKRSLPQIKWIGRDGKPLSALGPPGDFHFLSLSPDGKRVAVVAVDSAGTLSMWMVDGLRGANSRLSGNVNYALAPHWSPDGRQLAFSHLEQSQDKWNLFVQPVGGMRPAERITRSENVQILDDWSSDGRFLAYSEQNPKTRSDLWVAPLSGGRKPFSYLATPFHERQAKFVPAGGGTPQWLAYVSDETGADEVYVQSFPVPDTKLRISPNGGVQPRWRRDAKELFYLSPDGSIMAVPVSITATGLQAGTPVALCKPPMAPLPAIFASVFEVAADGQRFLILAPSDADAPGVNVVVNWQAGLNR